MALVHLITTGVAEEKALAASLARLFPGHEFKARPRLDGFTSAPLPPVGIAASAPPSTLTKFAGALLGVFDPGNRRDRPRPDFVIAVEDVELVNADDPARITGSLRRAIETRLSTWPLGARELDRLRADLCTRVSFDLIAPMIEAYFFADPAALARATAPAADRPSAFDASACDVEAFVVDDPAYLATPPVDGCKWRVSANRERQRHPKRYLHYLTDPGTGSRYRETQHGADALAALDWRGVAARPSQVRIARSLLTDLGDMLGHSTANLDPEFACHPLTWPPPRDAVLRNL